MLTSAVPVGEEPGFHKKVSGANHELNHERHHHEQRANHEHELRVNVPVDVRPRPQGLPSFMGIATGIAFIIKDKDYIAIGVRAGGARGAAASPNFGQLRFFGQHE